MDQVVTTTASGLALIRNNTSKPTFAALDADGKVSVSNALPKTRHLDPKALLRVAFSERARSSETIWTNVRWIPPHCYLRTQPNLQPHPDDSLLWCGKKIATPSASIRAFNELRMSVKYRTGNSKTTYVSFSGGFDSTLLLCMAREQNAEHVKATTWTFRHGSANRDLEIASKICTELGVTHILMEVDPKLLFSSPKRSDHVFSVNTSILFSAVEANLFSGSEFDITADIILNGHGGDHILLDPVPAKIVLQILAEGGPAFALIKAREYSQLYSVSIPNLVKELVSRKQYIKLPTFLTDQGRAAFHLPDLVDIETASYNELYSGRIVSAIVDNATSQISDISTCVHHPFTDQSVLQALYNIHVGEMYDGRSTPSPLRRLAQDIYGSELFDRRDKGHVTGAFQHAIRDRFDELVAIIAQGVLVESGFVDLDGVVTSLRASSVGLGGVPNDITKLLSAELTAIAALGVH